MALIMFTGFETGEVATDLWDDNLGTPTAESTSPRSGTGAYYARTINGRLGFSSSSPLSGEWDPATETLFCGFALRRETGDSGEIAVGCNGGSGALHYATLVVAGNGAVDLQYGDSIAGGDVTVGTSVSGVIQDDTWHYVEIQFWPDATAGRLKLVVDGVVPTAAVDSLDFTGDTQLDSTRTAAGVQFRVDGDASSDAFEIDDMYICTDTASGNDPFTGLMGEQVVEAIVPTSDSSTAWTRSTGSNSYALVDEIPPSMTDYVTAASATLEDIYGMGNTTLTGAANAVAIHSAALQDTVTTGTFRVELNSSASTTNGATNALALARKDFYDLFPVDPNGSAAWSNSAVDAATVSIYSVGV